MQLIYKFIKDYNEILILIILLFSVIIILKTVKQKQIEGHFSWTKPTYTIGQCDFEEKNWGHLKKLLQYEFDIRAKVYEIHTYKGFIDKNIAEHNSNIDAGNPAIFNDALVVAHLNTETARGPEQLLINKTTGLYYLLIRYIIEKETLIDKNINLNYSTTPETIMKLVNDAERNVGYIWYYVWHFGSPAFQKYMPIDNDDDSLNEKVWRPNKNNIWKDKQRIWINADWSKILTKVEEVWNKSEAPLNKPWKLENSAYDIYYRWHKKQGYETPQGCTWFGDDDIGKDHNCASHCDEAEATMCWMAEYETEKEKGTGYELEMGELESQLVALAGEELKGDDITKAADAMKADALSIVPSCSSYFGYGDITAYNKTVAGFSQSEIVGGYGDTWCAVKKEADGTRCKFKKTEKGPKTQGLNRKSRFMKIFCTQGDAPVDTVVDDDDDDGDY